MKNAALSEVEMPGPKVRLRLDISYAGTKFSGWAAQPGLRTVQGELEAALGTVLRAKVALTVAGRTDAGVHARGQVAHLDVPEDVLGKVGGRDNRPPTEVLRRRISGILTRGAGGARGSSDVVVKKIDYAPFGFDARFSAQWRRYRYLVADSLSGFDPLTRHSVLWVPFELDTQKMDDAARFLWGEHDFLPFCKPREGATTIRTLQIFSWTRREDGLLEATVRADAFCHSMVRSLVGASLEVGRGRREITWPGDVLAVGKRDSAVQVAPAHGLSLEEVSYVADDQLATQAKVTRRRRDECCS